METEHKRFVLDADTIPGSVLNRSRQDPAKAWPGAPPNFGQDFLPHVFTVVGRHGLASRAYLHPDEALIHSEENAKAMRNEPAIMECLEARMRCVALLNWHIEPFDPDDLEFRDPMATRWAHNIADKVNGQQWDAKELSQKMTSILKHTPNFLRLRYSLMDALWFGRYASRFRFRTKRIQGRTGITMRSWTPVHGDKLVFRYDDGSAEYEDGQVGIRVGPLGDIDRHWTDFRGFQRNKVEATEHGLVYWLDQAERDTIAVHKHIIEDGDFDEPRKAGSIHGIGIRSRIYWTWWAYQECLRLLLEYTERSALGIEIWKYPAHNPQAKQATIKAATERGAPGRSTLLVPVMEGEYADMYQVQIVEPGLGGLNELKEVLQTFFGHKIKRYILGQTLTSEAEATGLGSGVADAHMATFHDIVKFDAINLEETITDDLLRPLQMANFPGSQDVYLKFTIDTETDDSQNKMGGYQQAWNMGVKLKAEDIYDIIGASKPTEKDEFLQNPAFAQQPSAPMVAGPFPNNPLPEEQPGGDVMPLLDDQAQYQAREKPERYASDFDTHLDDSHHAALGQHLENLHEGKQGEHFTQHLKRTGLALDHPLKTDDQHLILFHAGLLDHPITKHMFGPDYQGSQSELPETPLHKFMSKAASVLRDHGDDKVRQRAAERAQGARVVSFSKPNSGRLVLHPSVRKDNGGHPWQLTEMSHHDGRPWGHMNFPTFEEGLHAAMGVHPKSGSYYHSRGRDIEWTDKDGTKAPFSAFDDAVVDRYAMHSLFGDGSSSHVWPKMAVVGKTNHVSKCENCGREGLKYAVVCSVLDDRGRPTTEYHYFGSDCAAKIAGKSEKEVEDEADQGRPASIRPPKPKKPTAGQLDLFSADSSTLIDRYHSIARWADNDSETVDRYAQMMFDWHEEEHPRETEDHDGKHPGEFAPKDQDDSKKKPENKKPRRKLKDNEVAMVHAKAVVEKDGQMGEISPVDGVWRRAGHWMPVHGLHVGQEKPQPKAKKGEGDSPVVNPEKSKGPPVARKRSPEEVEAARREREEQDKWDQLRTDKVGQVYWMGDKVGYTGWDQKKQLIPYLETLTNDQVRKLGDKLRDGLLERQLDEYFKTKDPNEKQSFGMSEPRWEMTRAEAKQEWGKDFDEEAKRNGEWFVTKKLRKQLPDVENALHGLVGWLDRRDKRQPMERVEALNQILKDVEAMR